ncbi:MAG: NUDIX hydrolase [bacterium]
MSNNSGDVVWEGPSWRVRSYHLTRPDGSIAQKAYVEHPGAVVLVPVRGDEVLMLRQYRASLADTILELPAGTRGQDEEWESCAQRELREETGYRAESLTALGHVWPAPGYSDEVLAIYLAQELHPDPLAADFDEIIELQPMPLETVEAMAWDGRLRDAKSVIGVLRAAAYFQASSPPDP